MIEEMDPPVCRCGHYFYVHPCTGWELGGRMIRVGLRTYVKVLHQCRCKRPRRKVEK